MITRASFDGEMEEVSSLFGCYCSVESQVEMETLSVECGSALTVLSVDFGSEVNYYPEELYQFPTLV